MQNEFKIKSIGRRLPWGAFAAAGLAIAVAGCGGGGGGSTPDPTTSRASLTVQWSARSRAIAAPASALSAVVRIAGAGVSSGDVVFTINRDGTKTDGYTQQYTAPTDARTGQFTVTITFHSQADGEGGVVGSVSEVVTLISGANSLGDVTVNGTVASVTVAAKQTIVASQAADLVFTAFDASNAAIAGLAPGAAFFTVTDGQSLVSVVNGQLKAGATPGIATVSVTVDGKTSAGQKIGIGTATSTLATTGLRGTIPLYASVADLAGAVSSTSGTVALGQSLSVSSNWFYTDTATAPAGYGDRQFDHWANSNLPLSSASSYRFVPAESVANFALTAVYASRTPPTGGFTPNFSRSVFLHWGRFPIRVYVANPEYTDRLKAGLDKWVGATGGVVSYETVANASQADVTITLGTPLSGNKGLTTVAFDPDSREIQHADIVLLQSAPTETYPGVDLLALYATHEFGHALGMTASSANGFGHSTDPKDTMFVSTNPSAPLITEQDINTLENIYPTLFDGGPASLLQTRSVAQKTKSGKTAKLIVP